MRSKWFVLKDNAIKLRKDGKSIRNIENLLQIPRSTLSGWFRDIKLTDNQRSVLHKNHIGNLIKARCKAVIWHNAQKEIRIRKAKEEALIVLSKLNLEDLAIQDLALSMLYLGEGGKTNRGTCMGSSDPNILKFFINILIKNHKIGIDQIKCELHLRADQNVKTTEEYWSKILNVPLRNFYPASIDKRTQGRRTYPDYNGVCSVTCGNIAVQRRLIYLSKGFCEIVNKMDG